MGLDSHLADSVKAVRLMLGIDDNREDVLHLVPRFPESWKTAGVQDIPALLGGKPGSISYSITRDSGAYTMNITASDTSAIDVRVGPFTEKPGSTAIVNGAETPIVPFRSGDSWWAWIKGLTTARELTIRL
jgi:hypothetical protein